MRRTATLVATVAMVILAAAPAQAATEGWWHTPGYTVGNSGFNPNERAITAATVKDLKLKDTSLTGSTDLRAPVLDKGRVFVSDAKGITAFVESSGERLWRWEYPADERSETAQLIIKGEVLVSGRVQHHPNSGGFSAFGVVETFDARTGERLGESELLDGGFTRMLVDGDHVVVSITENRWGWDTAVLKLDDLSLVWGSSSLYTNPVAAKGKILLSGYAAHNGSEIRDIATGKVLWRGENMALWPVAADDAGTKFYVRWGHSLQILDATTGALTWLASNLGPGHVTISPTRIYVAHGAGVSVFDAFTGRPAFWTRTFPAAVDKPIVAGGVLYVTVPGDRIHMLDPVSGNPITTVALTGATRTPVVTNGVLYLTDGTQLKKFGL